MDCFAFRLAMPCKGVSNDEGLAFPLSLRGSVRNRGNPVFGNEPQWIASACRLAMTGRGVRKDGGGGVFAVIARFRRTRGNPVFDNEPQWIASPYGSQRRGKACAMTRSWLFRCHCEVPKE